MQSQNVSDKIQRSDTTMRDAILVAKDKLQVIIGQ